MKRRRRMFRAHLNCWYCGYRTWLVFTRPAGFGGFGCWEQKPPWIRLGACCHDATLALSDIGGAANLSSWYQAPLDDLSPSQLRRRLHSKPLPGTKRDPGRHDQRGPS